MASSHLLPLPLLPLLALLLLGSAIGTSLAGASGDPLIAHDELENLKVVDRVDGEEKLDVNLWKDVVEQLRRNIGEAWQRFRGALNGQEEEVDQVEMQGQFAVVALNELRKFRLHLEEEVEQHRLRAARVKGNSNARAEEGNEKPGSLGKKFANVVRSLRKRIQEYVNEGNDRPLTGDFNLDEFLSQPPPPPPLTRHHQVDKDGDTDDNDDNYDIVRVPITSTLMSQSTKEMAADDARELKSATSYEDYVEYVRRHNTELRSEKLESIRQRTVEFVESLFVSEAKELAFALLSAFFANKMGQTPNVVDPINTSKLIFRLQQNFIYYLTGVVSDLLALIMGRKSVDHFKRDSAIYSK